MSRNLVPSKPRGQRRTPLMPQAAALPEADRPVYERLVEERMNPNGSGYNKVYAVGADVHHFAHDRKVGRSH